MPDLNGRLRWVALATFGYNTGFNAFMCMDYAAISSIAKDALGTDDAGVNWLYSGLLLAVLPATVPAAIFTVRAPVATALVGICLNVGGAWLRWLSITTGSYAIALTSSVIIGFAAAIIICSYTALAHRLFPADERALATTIAVQCNYFGWAIGSLMPLIVRDPACVDSSCAGLTSYSTAMLAQAIAVSFALPLYFVTDGRALIAECSPASKAINANFVPTDAHESGDGGRPRLLLRNAQFWIHAACYSIMGGISFTIPGIQDQLFTSCLTTVNATNGTGVNGTAVPIAIFGSTQTLWTNFAFISAGVATGLTIGTFVKDTKKYGIILRLLFVVTSLALSGIAVLANSQVAGAIDSHTLYAMLVLLMTITGAGSLGFIGLGLRTAVSVSEPVDEAYVGGGVEWLIQAWGAFLTQISDCNISFYACAAGAWLVTGLILCAARFPSHSPDSDDELKRPLLLK